MERKAFFFLQHNNDIDNIIPVLYKWLSKEDIETHVIITTDKNYLTDYRIKYLKRFKNVNIYHISILIKKSGKLYGYIYDMWKNLNFPKSKNIRDFLYINPGRIKERFKEIFSNLEAGIAVFDWTTGNFNQLIVKIANKKGLVTIALPHGGNPLINKMIGKNDCLNPESLPNGAKFNNFDYWVSQAHLMPKRYKDLNKNKIKILGSARYSDEWINILTKIKPSVEFDQENDKIKILLFLRKPSYPIFWDEVARTIKMISNFSDIFLIIKHHPRGGKGSINKLSKVGNLENVRHVLHEISTESLIDWADLILDAGGTSATWEPIKKGKPVLMLEYLHANYSTVASYIKETNIFYRDQLYNFIRNFVKKKNINFYISNGRELFIKEVIDFPDKHILERYCNFLKNCLDESYKKIKKNN